MLHAWDVEEAFDKSVTLQRDAVPDLLDNPELVIRFSAKTTGGGEVLNVRTTEAQREFVLTLGAESVTLEDGEGANEHDVKMAAEAFVRLLYVRLDAEYTPPAIESAPRETSDRLSRDVGLDAAHLHHRGDHPTGLLRRQATRPGARSARQT